MNIQMMDVDRSEPAASIDGMPILLYLPVRFWVLFALLVASAGFSKCLSAQQQLLPLVMPMPAHITPGAGEFPLDSSFGIGVKGYDEARLSRARERFMDILARETGIPFRRDTSCRPCSLTLETGGPSAPIERLGEDESYHLEISTSSIDLKAANPLGILHGLQTLLQLVRINQRGFNIPAVSIDDSPRFPWRGLLIDSGHRFVPIPVVKRNLDGMEAVKLNVFHWRFADDQGFHIESKKYPRLQKAASGGFYYTQQQVREVIEYARDRGIRVVPEFDMPCHSRSWFQGYAELAGGVNPKQSSAMDPTRESTYVLLAGFIGEMSALFPDAYFHTGGDECDPKEWEENPRIERFMKAHSIKDGAELQARFTARIERIVAQHNKIMEGWDEVLRPDTPKNVVIQSWRGPASLAEAARRGYRAVLSSGYYIDLNQSAAEHYLVDPLGNEAAVLTPEEKRLVLGGEATMWTDIVSAENLDNRVWPRTAAIAERLWSPQELKDVDWMYERLEVVSQKLEYFGLRHRVITEEMLERMSGDPHPRALRVLAAVVQPPKGYERQQLRSFTDSTPLNRMDDAVPPESEVAREFDQITLRISGGRASSEDWKRARAWLSLWRDNDAELQPLLKRSSITEDLAPVSTNLRRVAEIGLETLDEIDKNRTVDPKERQAEVDFLNAAAQPQAVLLLMPADSVKRLVLATKSY